jgi:hypothetical protein
MDNDTPEIIARICLNYYQMFEEGKVVIPSGDYPLNITFVDTQILVYDKEISETVPFKVLNHTVLIKRDRH